MPDKLKKNTQRNVQQIITKYVNLSNYIYVVVIIFCVT